MSRAQKLAQALLVAALAGAVLQCAATFGGLGELAETVDRWLGAAVPVLGGAALCLRAFAAERARRAWLLIGAALILWGAADI